MIKDGCPLCGAAPIGYNNGKHCLHPSCPWFRFTCGNVHYPKYGTNKGCSQ